MLETQAQTHVTLKAHLRIFSEEMFSERHLKFKLFSEKHALMVSYLTIEAPQVSPYLLARKQCDYIGAFVQPLK